MSYFDVPAKVLECFVETQVGDESWPFDDGTNDPFWRFGRSPRDYRWKLTMRVTEQRHSSHKTRDPYVYNGMDIKVGDYVASSTDGVAVRVVRIDRKTEDSVVCIVEDVFRYNTFRDSAGLGSGIFSSPTSAVVFEANDAGVPVVDPLPASGVGPTFYANLMSRFQNLEKNSHFLLWKPNHGFEVGQLVSADADNNSFALTDDGNPFLIGRVSFVYGDHHFTINPIQKIIDNLDSLVGEVGDVLYADPAVPGGVTVTEGTNAVMIKLRELSETEILGTVVNANTESGNAMLVNGHEVYIPDGSMEGFCDEINATTADHGVTARVAPVSTISATITNLVNAYYSEPLLAIDRSGSVRPSANINGTMVTFDTTRIGELKYGETLATAEDMAEDINAANIPGIRATFVGVSLVLTNDLGTPINIINDTADARGHNFAGTNSGSGLRLSEFSSVGEYVRLQAVDARAINLANLIGDPVDDFGLYSVENGVKAAALYVEKGIRQATNMVVPDIASRNALASIRGDQSYVIDKGDGEWGQYLYDGSQWRLTASQETAKVDSDTYSAQVSNATSTAPLGEVGPGSKVTSVMVVVTQAFDSSASITVGDSGSANRLATNDLIDLSTVGTYAVTPSYIYSSDTMINVYVNASQSNTGQAVVSITYQ